MTDVFDDKLVVVFHIFVFAHDILFIIYRCQLSCVNRENGKGSNTGLNHGIFF